MIAGFPRGYCVYIGPERKSCRLLSLLAFLTQEVPKNCPSVRAAVTGNFCRVIPFNPSSL